MEKMMLKKQTRSLQKLFLVLLGLGATVNIYAVEIDNMSINTAASDTDFREPTSIDDANKQLDKASFWGEFKKVEYLTDSDRTYKPEQHSINLAVDNAVRRGYNDMVQYFKKNHLVDETGCKNILRYVLMQQDGDFSEPYEYFFGPKSSFPINPSKENQIWALNTLFSAKSYRTDNFDLDLAKLHSFSGEALKECFTLRRYLDANPLSDDEFNRIMAITAKDGESSPFGIYLIERALNGKFNPCVLAKIPFSKKVFEGIPALSKYLDANELSDKKFYQIMQITKDGRNTPFAEYLVDRYLNGKRDVSTQAMDNVMKNSQVDKSGRFGVGRLKRLSKTPHLPVSGGSKGKDVMQHISDYDGNSRIEPDLFKRVKPYWEGQRVNGIAHQPVVPNGIAHQPVAPNEIAHQPVAPNGMANQAEENKEQNLVDTTVNNAAGNGQNRRHNPDHPFNQVD